MDERMSAAEVIAAVIKRAEDDAYLHGAWNSRPNVEPQAVLDALREAGWALTALPKPDDDQGDGIAFWTDQEVGVADGMVVARFDPGNEAIYYEPDAAKALATALLAAAAAVSQDGEQ